MAYEPENGDPIQRSRSKDPEVIRHLYSIYLFISECDEMGFPSSQIITGIREKFNEDWTPKKVNEARKTKTYAAVIKAYKKTGRLPLDADDDPEQEDDTWEDEEKLREWLADPDNSLVELARIVKSRKSRATTRDKISAMALMHRIRSDRHRAAEELFLLQIRVEIQRLVKGQSITEEEAIELLAPEIESVNPAIKQRLLAECRTLGAHSPPKRLNSVTPDSL